jgi:4-diphosphocytidyl-2-C-methyl-D-erythritol kinase
LNGFATDDPKVLQAARKAGADVPACIEPRTRLMQGIGDELSPPINLPPLDAVIVFPGTSVATRDVFHSYASTDIQSGPYHWSRVPTERGALLEFLIRERNDLEPAASNLVPAIGDARRVLEKTGRPLLVRMSGSGSAVFAIYENGRNATEAAAEIRDTRPDWWIIATTLG